MNVLVTSRMIRVGGGKIVKYLLFHGRAGGASETGESDDIRSGLSAIRGQSTQSFKFAALTEPRACFDHGSGSSDRPDARRPSSDVVANGGRLYCQDVRGRRGRKRALRYYP